MFTIPSIDYPTVSTAAGIITANKGSAIIIYSVLKMFQSCDSIPLSNKLMPKEKANALVAADSALPAMPSTAFCSFILAYCLGMS